jgi:hypothetical protein
MINQFQNLQPFIDFGFGLTHKSIPAGASVTVWLTTLYNTEAYNVNLAAQGSVTKVSDYEYNITFNTPGLYEINMIASAKKKKISLQSNVITVNVI